VLGVVSVLIEFPILIGYGWLAHKGGRWFRQSKYATWLDRLAGTFLVGAGVKLAFTKS
jgi:threonine/homoserine/homoserine lactone efflux protein